MSSGTSVIHLYTLYALAAQQFTSHTWGWGTVVELISDGDSRGISQSLYALFLEGKLGSADECRLQQGVTAQYIFLNNFTHRLI